MEKLRRDNFWMGLILGFLVPGIIFGLLWGIVAIIEHFTGNIPVITSQKVLLLSVVPNLFILRYYLLKLKYDLTGRGIVSATFVLAILFAILEFAL